MSATGALVALLPWLAGSVWCRRAMGDAGWPLALGYGFFVGAGTTALGLAVGQRAGLGISVWPVLAFALPVLLAGVALPRRGPLPPAAAAAGDRRGGRLLFAIGLLVLAVKATLFATDAFHRPVFAWDAWNVWSLKAKVWSSLGEVVPFVDEADWVARGGAGVYHTEAWHYPDLVPLVQSWVALAAGGWDERWVNLLWPLCWVALLLGFYGQLRRLEVGAVVAIWVTYLLGSLPMFQIHATLAGYADLWLAGIYLLAFMNLLVARTLRLRGDAGRAGREWALALLLVLMLPFVKRDGFGWVATLLLPAGLSLGAARWRRALPWVVAAGVVAGALALPRAGGLLPGLLPLPELSRQIPSGIGRQLLVSDNWHLLWFLAPPLLVAAIGRRRRVPALDLPLGALAGAGAMLYLLLFWTEAGQWVSDGTLLNRVLMPVAGLLAVLAAMLAGVPAPPPHRASAGPGSTR